MLPPPETTLQVPPAGVAERFLVDVSQIAALLVVLVAAPANGFTIKLTSEVLPAQLPVAATVYLICTVVLDETSAGV